MRIDTSALPGRVRVIMYWAYALVGVTIGSIQVGFAAAQVGQPVWLVVALAIYAYLGVAFGMTAATNVVLGSSAATNVVLGSSADDNGEDEFEPEPEPARSIGFAV